MTGTEPIEVEELSGRVLEIIGAYRMDAALDPRDLSPKTIDTYRSRLMQKLSLGDVPALVKFAIQHGLIALD